MKMITTTAKIPEELDKSINIAVIESGYGFRGKNKWLNQAVDRFLKLPDMCELVDMADDIETFDKTVSMKMTLETARKIEEAVITVRKQYPAMEGVKSNILRASIMQFLIRGKNPVTG